MEAEQWTLKEKTAYILARLKDARAISFQGLFEEDRTISEFVITFLALLELVHMGLITVIQGDPDKDIQIRTLDHDD